MKQSSSLPLSQEQELDDSSSSLDASATPNPQNDDTLSSNGLTHESEQSETLHQGESDADFASTEIQSDKPYQGKLLGITPNYRGLLTVLFVSSLIDYMSYGVIVPILPFFAKTFDAEPIVIGLLLGTYDFMSIFAPSFWGSWSDRVGRRPAMLMNIAGTATAFLIFGFANSLLMLFIGRMLSGASGSSIVIGQSYIARYAKQETRTRDLGILAASAVFGMVLGASLISFLIGANPDEVNYNLPGLIAFGLSVLTFSAAFMLLPREEVKEQERSTLDKPEAWFLESVATGLIEAFKAPGVNKLLFLIVIIYMAQAGSQTLLPLWFDHQFHWGPKQYSYILMLCALIIGGTQAGLLGILSKRLSETSLVLWGMLGLSVGAILIPFVNELPALLVVLAIATVGQGINNPSVTSLLIANADVSMQSRVLGLAQSLGSLGAFLGALGGGFVFGALGPQFPYWISGGILLITLMANRRFIAPSRSDTEATLMSVSHESLGSSHLEGNAADPDRGIISTNQHPSISD